MCISHMNNNSVVFFFLKFLTKFPEAIKLLKECSSTGNKFVSPWLSIISQRTKVTQQVKKDKQTNFVIVAVLQ